MSTFNYMREAAAFAHRVRANAFREAAEMVSGHSQWKGDMDSATEDLLNAARIEDEAAGQGRVTRPIRAASYPVEEALWAAPSDDEQGRGCQPTRPIRALHEGKRDLSHIERELVEALTSSDILPHWTNPEELGLPANRRVASALAAWYEEARRG